MLDGDIEEVKRLLTLVVDQDANKLKTDTEIDTTNLGQASDSANTDSTTSGSLIAFVKGLVSRLARIVSVSFEITRPADTTAYTALDAVSNSTSAPVVITFTNAARVTGGSGYIIKAQLATDQKTNTARFRLHLFNAAPTPINDNSPYLTLYANIANRIGTIDFPACNTEDPTNSTQATSQVIVGSTSLPMPFVCAADANLYGILEALDGFTPSSGQKITIKLSADQN